MHGLITLPKFRLLPKSLSLSIRFSSMLPNSSLHYYRDSFEYSHLLQSCRPGPRNLNQIHAQIITAGHSHNPFLASKLVSRYTALECVEDARQVFDRTPQRDTLLWNNMIQGYANSTSPSEAISMFNQMRQSAVGTNHYTYPFVLKACSAVSDDKTGKALHANAIVAGLDSGLFVSNALVAFYARCREIESSRRVFDEITARDLVSWNSMIAGYAQNDHFHEAIELLHRMLRDDSVKPDRVTLVTLLPACTALSAAREGMWIHSFALRTGMGVDAKLGSGLIGLYASCGRLKAARRLFDGIIERNLVLYNSMMQAYGTYGRASDAMEIFSEVVATGIMPDAVCFISLLSACSHAGMVDKGFEIFEMMDEYGVEKNQIHYACMVDLLGRSGKLSQAFEFVKEMPMEPGKDVWGALLGACRIWNDVALAEEAAKRLFLLDPENAGRYSVLAKMYEDLGRWEDAARVRKAMRDRGVKKPLGYSMVEVDAEVYTFGVEDESHPMTDEIYEVLGLLRREVGEETAMC